MYGGSFACKIYGQKKVITETGAGQQGVALATAAAYFGLECDIYMGSVDIKKTSSKCGKNENIRS